MATNYGYFSAHPLEPVVTSDAALESWNARFTSEQLAAQRAARARLHALWAAQDAEATRQHEVHLARVGAS